MAYVSPLLSGGKGSTGYVSPLISGGGGGGASPAKSSGGGIGGFLHDVVHSPARLAEGLVGLGQAGYDLGKVVVKGDVGVARGAVAAATRNKAQQAKAQREQNQANAVIGSYAKGIAKDYGKRYGPLEQGHVGKFAGQLAHDPLPYLLDAATVATLGGAGAAKAGSLLEKANAISKESKLAQLGKPVDLKVPDWNGEAVTIKQSSSNPVIRTRQVATNKALQRLPERTPVVGSSARVVRAISKSPERAAARLRVQAEPFNQAFSTLSANERAAWHMAARGIYNPADYKAFIASHPDVSPAMLKILDRPQVAELTANPTPRLQDALDKGRALSDLMTNTKVYHGLLDETTAAESPYRTLRLMSGAKVVDETPALLGVPSQGLQRMRSYVSRLELAHGRAAAVAQRFRFTAADAKKIGQVPLEDRAARVREGGGPGQPVVTSYPTNESVNLRAQLRPLEKELRAMTEQWNAPAKTEGPAPRMSEADAQARLAELDTWHEGNIQQAIPEVSPWGPQVKGSAAKREQLWRNTVNAKLPEGAKLPTVKSEERAAADRHLHETAAKNAAIHPTAARFHALLTERQQLREALNQRGEQAIFGEAPTVELPTTGSAEPSIYEQRSGLHRILRTGTVAHHAMTEFANAAGTDVHVPGLEELRSNVDELTNAINEARGYPSEDLKALRKQVAEVRSMLRAAEAPRSYRVGGEQPYALTPDGRKLKPIGSLKAERLSAALSVARDRLAQMEAGRARRMGETGIVGGKPIEQIAQELHTAGKTQPFYVPDSAAVRGMRGRMSRRPTGLNEPGLLGSQRQNRGELVSRGMLNVHENALGRELHQLANRTEGAALHDEILKHAAELPAGQPLPLGYEYLKVSRGESGATYLDQTRNQLENALEPGSADKFLTHDANHPQLATRNGNRLVVPDTVRKILEARSGSYSNAARSLLYDQPTSVWKHLVLGLRPAFFVNNTVGNSVLGALQMAPGLHGPAEWLRQVVPGSERVLGSKVTADTVGHVFPEQAGGTFGGTMGFRPNKGLRVAQKAYQGVMPATIQYENVLRRAMLGGWARHQPEVRALMEANGGDINQALRDLSQTHPHIIDEISRRTDDALGNYRTYNRFERHIRNVIPFYGWDRHIVRSTARLTSERPAVVNALLHAGEVGNQRREQQLGPGPTYTDPLVGLPGLPSFMGPLAGRTPVLNTKSLNPFNTMAELTQLPGELAGKPGGGSEILSGLNPFLQTLLEQATGRSLMTGAPMKRNAFEQFLESLPQAALIQTARGKGTPTKPTSLYQTDWETQLATILGIPVKKVNLATQHYRAKLAQQGKAPSSGGGGGYVSPLLRP